MGGHLSCLYVDLNSAIAEPLPPIAPGVLKVILACEGRTCEFFEPVKVAELMLEFPNHFVAEYDSHAHHAFVHAPTSAETGAGAAAAMPICSKRVYPLPADHDAKLSHVYLVLPMHRLNTRLSTEELNLISSLVATYASPAAAPQCMPMPSSLTTAAHTSSKVTPLSARRYQEAVSHTSTTTQINAGPIEASASCGSIVSIAKSYSVPILELMEDSSVVKDTDGSEPADPNTNQHFHILRSKSWTPKLETINEHIEGAFNCHAFL